MRKIYDRFKGRKFRIGISVLAISAIFLTYIYCFQDKDLDKYRLSLIQQPLLLPDRISSVQPLPGTSFKANYSEEWYWFQTMSVGCGTLQNLSPDLWGVVCEKPRWFGDICITLGHSFHGVDNDNQDLSVFEFVTLKINGKSPADYPYGEGVSSFGLSPSLSADPPGLTLCWTVQLPEGEFLVEASFIDRFDWNYDWAFRVISY